MKSKLMAAAALVAMGGAAQAQLVNGSFETPAALATFPFYTVNPDGANIGGWTVVGCGVACASDAVTLLNNQLSTAPGGLPGHSTPYGNQWIDLTGDGNFGYSSVTQTIGGLVAGTVYTLSFALGATGLHDAVVSVTLPGASGVYTTPASGAGGFANVWNTYSLDFTAGASNTLTFTGVAASGGPTSIGLDNITVTAVPEPSAYAMALAGLGALGFMARRRKSRA